MGFWGLYGDAGGGGGAGCPFGVAVGFLGRSRVHVVLEGEDDGIWGRLEGALSNGLNHLLRVMGSAGSAGSMGSMGSVALKGSLGTLGAMGTVGSMVPSS